MSFITKAQKFSPLIKPFFAPEASLRTFQTGFKRTGGALPLGIQANLLLKRTPRPCTPVMTQVIYKSDSNESPTDRKGYKLQTIGGLIGLVAGAFLILLDKRAKQNEIDAIISRGDAIYDNLLSQMPDKPLFADHRFREELEINLSMRMLGWNSDTQRLVMAKHLIRFDESVTNANMDRPASQPRITHYQAFAAYKNLRDELRDYKSDELIINDPHLTMIPLEIYFIPLKKLEIYAPISSLPEKLSCGELTHLKIQSHYLYQFPLAITKLINLRYLNLGHNKIPAVPDSISDLKNLESLHLNDNSLISLPESIGELRKLNLLNLSGNSIAKLPEGMSRLEELTFLSLNGNLFRQFPKQISQLRNLALVDLQDQKTSA